MHSTFFFNKCRIKETLASSILSFQIFLTKDAHDIKIHVTMYVILATWISSSNNSCNAGEFGRKCIKHCKKKSPWIRAQANAIFASV